MAWNHPYRIAQWLDYYKTASTCDPVGNNSVEGCFYNFGNMTISASGTICATSEPGVAMDVGTEIIIHGRAIGFCTMLLQVIQPLS